ncbi:ATP-binding cassette domain-containing protein, partial [Thermoproteota archaeon]
MKTRISVKNLEKRYGTLNVLKDISFDVKEKEFVSIVGQSGCGKTTLLYLIEGFLEKEKGKISVKGKTGFVFQEHNLFPWKTVKENIMEGLLNQRLCKDEAGKIVGELLKDMSLSEFGDYYPYQISDGM